MRNLKSLLFAVVLVLAAVPLGPLPKARADYDVGACRWNWGCWFAGATKDGYVAQCYYNGEQEPREPLPGTCVCEPELYGDIYPCA
jgi:hypothetical protein